MRIANTNITEMLSGFTIFFIIVLPATSHQAVNTTVEKPYVLRLLHLVPLTGNAPRTGFECLRSSQIVVDKANAMPDFLPDYRIEIAPADEFTSGNRAAASTFTFLNDFETRKSRGLIPTNTFISPAFVAGYFSNGCASLGSTLQHLGLVSFSITCASIPLTNRKIYPNMYLTRTISTTRQRAVINFMKRYGKWNRIGILGNLGNSNDHNVGADAFAYAIRNGFTVGWYMSIMDLNDISPIISLKESGVRVVTLSVSNLEIVRRFLCTTYQLGLTGSRYVFFISNDMLAAPSTIPNVIYPGCTKEMIVEQYKYCFAIGVALAPFNRTAKSEFGYNANDFEAELDRRTNASRGADYSNRYACHDSTLLALKTLHEADKAMKRTGANVTLRDFSSRPLEVMTFLQNSAAKIEVIGLRTGRITYDSKGQYVGDMAVLGYVKDALENFGFVRLKDSNIEDLDVYSMQELGPIPWIAGKPQKDSPSTTLKLEVVPFGIFYAVTVISSLTALVHLSLAVRKLVKDNRHESEALCDFVGAFGCVILNVASILFSIRTDAGFRVDERILWSARIVLLVLGMSLMDGILIGKLHACKMLLFGKLEGKLMRKFSSFLSARGAITSPHENGVNERTQNLKVSTSMQAHIASRLNVMNVAINPKELIFPTLAIAWSFICVNIVVLVIWLVVDPLYCIEMDMKSFYDIEQDTVYTNFVPMCFSKYQMAWQFSLFGFHVLLLMLSIFQVHSLQSLGARKSFPRFGWLVIGIVNAIAILVLAMLLLLVLRDVVQQEIALSFLPAILSSAMTITWFAAG